MRIEPIDLARKHFGEFKEKGGEIIPKLCPFCQGGSHNDTYSFAMNRETGTFNCKRGSCGVSGSFSQLCKEFGEVSVNREFKPVPKKSYTPPKTQVNPAKEKVESYLKKRGFSKATWERRGVGEDGGNIAMPYYENGKLVLVKFRKPEKYKGEGQKAWREKGGKAVFWGMDDCDHSKPLVIVEGEMDALALDECGVENVVSVPSGAEDLTCVENCWEWLEAFDKVILWPDNDEPGQEMCRKLVAKLGEWRCYIVQVKQKDANDCMFLAGKEAVLDAIRNAKEVPISGLIRLADVTSLDIEKLEKVYANIKPIDKELGGFMMGQITVWTGINASGKSTMLGQLLLEAIEQRYSVCAYSGELSGPLFRYWIDVQAAGPENLESRVDKHSGKESFHPTASARSLIRAWYRDNFFLYDSFGSAKDDDILKIFEYASRRYNAKVFMIDNLMTTFFTDQERDFYRKQSNFVGKVKQFAQNYGVHVHVVAHPRKTEGRLTKMDVAGSGDITSRADNVLAVHRIENPIPGFEDCDAILDIFKNRLFGSQNIEIGLRFDTKSKRFYLSDGYNLTKNYSWTGPSEVPPWEQ